MIKKADIILYIVFILFFLATAFGLYITNYSGEKVMVSVDGNVYGVYPIDKNAIIEITNNHMSNTLVISDGYAKIGTANCYNQLCVNHQPINKTSEAIVCLPHKLTVEILGEEASEYDSITK